MKKKIHSRSPIRVGKYTSTNDNGREHHSLQVVTNVNITEVLGSRVILEEVIPDQIYLLRPAKPDELFNTRGPAITNGGNYHFTFNNDFLAKIKPFAMDEADMEQTKDGFKILLPFAETRQQPRIRMTKRRIKNLQKEQRKALRKLKITTPTGSVERVKELISLLQNEVTALSNSGTNIMFRIENNTIRATTLVESDI